MVAVAIVLDVAFNSSTDTVMSGADLAERTGIVRRTLEPLLQALSREHLLESTRGPHGGYRLGRPARLIKLFEVIAIALNSLDDSGPELTGRLQRAVIEPLWDELDTILLEQTAAMTIDDLLRRAAKAGLRKAVTEPLNFMI
jgi:Rrf2 family transcriptional regulator, iron-sulfur cluster assembly transcription factor